MFRLCLGRRSAGSASRATAARPLIGSRMESTSSGYNGARPWSLDGRSQSGLGSGGLGRLGLSLRSLELGVELGSLLL